MVTESRNQIFFGFMVSRIKKEIVFFDFGYFGLVFNFLLIMLTLNPIHCPAKYSKITPFPQLSIIQRKISIPRRIKLLLSSQRSCTAAVLFSSVLFYIRNTAALLVRFLQISYTSYRSIITTTAPAS